MKNASVQEHGSKKGVEVFPPHYRLRNHPVFPNNVLQKIESKKPGYEENHHINNDDGSGEVRCG
jgi:hypothetical protein